MLNWLQGSNDVHALMARGNYGKAIKALERHLVEDPQSIHLRQLLADALTQNGEPQKAVDILHRLADDFTTQGFTAKAIAVLKKAQRTAPGHPETEAKLSELAKVHEATRRRAEPAPQESPPPPAAAPAETPPRPEPVAYSDSTEIERPPTLTSEIVLSEFWFEEAAQGREDFHWSPLLDSCSRPELEALIGGLQLLVKKPGSIIYSEGEPGSSLFVLAAGWARVYRRAASFHNEQIGLFQEGQFFGEAAVLDRPRRDETVIAATDCELLELDRPTFRTIVALHPRVRKMVEDLRSQEISRD